MIFVRNGNNENVYGKTYLHWMNRIHVHFWNRIFYVTFHAINNLSPNGFKLVGLSRGFIWQKVQKIVQYLTTSSWIIVIFLALPFFFAHPVYVMCVIKDTIY